MEMTYSNCGGYGHNKRSCPKKARPADSTPANASYIQRCGGRGRGRARGTGTPTTSTPAAAGRGRGTAASRGRGTGSGRGSSGFGLFQSSSGFTSFSSVEVSQEWSLMVVKRGPRKIFWSVHTSQEVV
ncbi:uncharacterized protein [Nicotiana sylvestris]|uniref:uncharacterized protein n=1 Tax=Nicotiana sylvestris TaxID=4096 RepID=UPI00388C4FA7